MMEIQEGLAVEGGVVMDLAPVPPEKLEKLKPLLPLGRSSQEKTFLVSPTAHFCMGGIVADETGAASVPGLFAAGEVCGGIHGANRLAGNALTEVFAMGSGAGREAARRAREMGREEIPRPMAAEEQDRLASLFSASGVDPASLRSELKQILWLHGGIVRREEGLKAALRRLESLGPGETKAAVRNPKELTAYLEFENMLLVSEMVCRAALFRRESRGAHWRSDFPREDNENWLRNIFIRREAGGGMSLDSAPLPLSRVRP
jgi:succinate dehydrogenase/fumarate reductase flavoprotein subunit